MSLGKKLRSSAPRAASGKEIARVYAREGAKVVDLSADAAAAALGGNDAIGIAMDISETWTPHWPHLRPRSANSKLTPHTKPTKLSLTCVASVIR